MTCLSPLPPMLDTVHLKALASNVCINCQQFCVLDCTALQAAMVHNWPQDDVQAIVVTGAHGGDVGSVLPIENAAYGCRQ